MTVTGRTTPRWGRDRSSRWDPGETNRWRSYPADRGHERPVRAVPGALVSRDEMPVPAEPQRAELPGRPGASERRLVVEWHANGAHGGGLMVALYGWYADQLALDERQLRFLRDTLNAWFPAETTD